MRCFPAEKKPLRSSPSGHSLMTICLPLWIKKANRPSPRLCQGTQLAMPRAHPQWPSGGPKEESLLGLLFVH